MLKYCSNKASGYNIVLKINEEVNKSEPDFKTIASFVSEDISLSAKVLKIANSSFFGLKFKVESVDRALIVLGLDNFNSIVLAAALRESFNNTNISQNILNDFHKHSLFVAGVAKFIAENVLSGQINKNHAYITGLFHDCGILLLAGRFPDYYSSLEQIVQTNQSLLSFEEIEYNTNHCLVSSHMIKSWHLDKIIWQSIPFHHNTEISIHEDSSVRRLTSLLILSEHLIEKLPGFGKTDPIYSLIISSDEHFAKILSELEIDIHDYECLEDNVEELVQLI